jgi:hypothetical protein
MSQMMSSPSRSNGRTGHHQFSSIILNPGPFTTSLGILVKKVQEAQVGDICDKLCSLILEGKAELR